MPEISGVWQWGRGNWKRSLLTAHRTGISSHFQSLFDELNVLKRTDIQNKKKVA